MQEANAINVGSVLFVCLGNICRSPLAQAAMEQAAEKYGLQLDVDSAGTGDWHIGSPPDDRAQNAALADGIDISAYAGRQISQRDFLEFDMIVALDHSNFDDLTAMGGDGPAHLSMMLDHLPGQEGNAVADPYYGNEEDFQECWSLVQNAADHLAQRIKRGDVC